MSSDLKTLSNVKMCVTQHNPTYQSFQTELTTEAPNMIKHNGTYYLLYSANGYGVNYTVCYATALTTKGPWTKYVNNPIIYRTANVLGPGHCCMTSSPDGSQLFIAYHMWNSTTTTDFRRLCIDKAWFEKDSIGGSDILKVDFSQRNPRPYPLINNCNTQQTITFTTIPNKTISDVPFTINATASSGLPITFSIVSGPATIVGKKITLNGKTGQVVVAANQAGNSTYCMANQQTQTFVVSDPNVKTIIWHFENSLEGWKLTKSYTGSASASILNLTITGADPFMNSPDSLNVNAASFPYIVIRAKNMTPTTTAAIYWIRNDNQNYSEAMHLDFPVNASETNYTEYKINMSANAEWTGTIKQIRVDFTQTASSGNVNIDYVALDNDGVITGINEQNINDNFIKIYPNPIVDNSFYIEFNNSSIDKTGNIELLNMQGEILLNQPLTGETKEYFSFKNKISSGIYLLKYYDEKNLIIKKIIIK